MEVVFYGAIASIWWLSSASVLLPFVLMLKFSKTFRDRWFSFFFMRVIGPLFNNKLDGFRKRTFQVLKEELEKEEHARGARSHHEILEIGIGGGANLAFYPETSVLTALDMNESFETYYRENQKKFPNITYKRTIHARAENMKEVEDSSMDIVICTYVMCSIDDLNLVLSEVKRVLKAGGKFVFLEHVAFPKNQWSFTVQHLLSPLWKIYFDGCIIDRDIGAKIEKAGFSNVIMEKRVHGSVFWYCRPQIMGVATK